MVGSGLLSRRGALDIHGAGSCTAHPTTTTCPLPDCLQWPSAFFLMGVSLVLLSVFMYGRALTLDARRLALWGQWARKVRAGSWRAVGWEVRGLVA